MSPIVSRRRRNDPAGWIDRTPGTADSSSISVSMSASACPSSIRRGFDSSCSIPTRIDCSDFSDRPRTFRSMAGLGGVAQVLEILDAERLVEDADGPGPDTGHPQELHERRRHLGAEPLVERHVARRHELADLLADRGADARDLRRVAAPIPLGHVLGRVGDGVRRAVVGDRLVDQLALDLEHVADLVEDPRQDAVRQVGRCSRLVILSALIGRGVDGNVGPVVINGRRQARDSVRWHRRAC